MLQLIGILFVFLIVYTLFKNWKTNNPVKWEKMQREMVEAEAARFKKSYENAMKRVPKSKWILMTRKEKSDVYAARENLEAKFSDLSIEAREIVINKHGLGKSFTSARNKNPKNRE